MPDLLTADPMPDDVRDRLIEIRCHSKRGGMMPPADFAFCEDCYKRWPDEYKAIGRQVFEETKPFGAR